MSMSPEPMSLGSPTQSPCQPAQPYLPQFLLGDINSPLLHRTQTPQQQQQQLMFHQQQQYGSSGNSQRYYGGGGSNSPPRVGGAGVPGGPNFLLPHHHHHHLMPHGSGSSLGRTYSMNAYDYGQMRPSSVGLEKVEPNMSGYGATYSPSTLHPATPSQAPGAPPINRLVDLMNTKPSSTTPVNNQYQSSVLEPNLSPYTPAVSHSQTRLNSPPSPGQIESSTYQETASSNGEDTWVTIFGHPPSATSFVLQEFATYGQIVRYVPPGSSEQGNWLHVKYQTRMQAQKALSKNGKILGGQFMVGVMSCMDRKVMSGATASTTFNLTSTNEENTEPPINKSTLPVRGFSGARLDRTQSLRAGVRPLSQLNRPQPTIHDDSSIDPNAAVKLPKKNTNVISKAMEFMFGW